MKKSQKRTTAAQKTKTASTKVTTGKAASKGPTAMGAGVKKKHVKGEGLCKVTFRLPSIAAPDAKRVCVVGDFNDWNIRADRMRRLKNGDYTISLELKTGTEYQFRYLIDEAKWENDWNADKYVKNPYGDSDNSVVVV